MPATETHNIGPIEARPASEAGALAHHAAACSCGLVMASTMESAVPADVNAHAAYWTARGQRVTLIGQAGVR